MVGQMDQDNIEMQVDRANAEAVDRLGEEDPYARIHDMGADEAWDEERRAEQAYEEEQARAAYEEGEIPQGGLNEQTQEMTLAQLDGLTNDELGMMLLRMREPHDVLKKNIDRVEIVLNKRLEESGATVLPASDFTIKRTLGSPIYDHNRLAALKEILPPTMIDEAFVAEHEEFVKVDAKWNGRKLANWSRTLGDEVKKIIEDATTRKPGKLTVESKEPDLPW